MTSSRLVVSLELVVGQGAKPRGVCGVKWVFAGIGVGVAVPARTQNRGEGVGGEETTRHGVVGPGTEQFQARCFSPQFPWIDYGAAYEHSGLSTCGVHDGGEHAHARAARAVLHTLEAFG